MCGATVENRWADFRGAFYFYVCAQSTKLDSSVMLLAYSSANL